MEPIRYASVYQMLRLQIAALIDEEERHELSDEIRRMAGPA